jgi:hypothetical protein
VTQVRKTSVRAIVRLVIAVCLLGMMPAMTAHPKSAKAATEYIVGSVGPAGGIVFYVATTPFKCDLPPISQTDYCKYLEAAPDNWNSGIDTEVRWGEGSGSESCKQKSISGAQGTSIGSGFTNTAAIMAACPDASGNNFAPAARAASLYAGSGLTDWFLPSRDELNQLFVSGYLSALHWSSSEYGAMQACVQQTSGPFCPMKSVTAWVRPVRAFGPVLTRPTVVTNEATLVTTSAATLNATVNATGYDSVVAFSYATTSDLSGAIEAAIGTPVTGSTDKTSTAALTGLKLATKYYYRASAANSTGTATGEIKNFTTTGVRPTVATNEATLVAASSATLNATVNANFIDTAVSFSYATTADLSGATVAATGTPVTGSTDKTSTAALTSLKPGTKYYYRASATNSIGTSTGEIKNFTTTGALPTVTTGSASSIKASSADLNAVVNANLLKTLISPPRSKAW